MSILYWQIVTHTQQLSDADCISGIALYTQTDDGKAGQAAWYTLTMLGHKHQGGLTATAYLVIGLQV